jgi:hypothetical protein
VIAAAVVLGAWTVLSVPLGCLIGRRLRHNQPKEQPAVTDQPTPTEAVDDERAARWARREHLGVLLSRAARGVLLPAEGPLLRATVEAELVDGEQARRDAATAHKALATALTENDRLRQQFAHIAEAPLNVDVWATPAPAAAAKSTSPAAGKAARATRREVGQ